ncbi:hypothetical protein C2E23DRAFT_314633 [Lenzites betulinus]|nr:hypothetical protein C2E23DRAFT_314633 [Lenzites betulinus]
MGIADAQSSCRKVPTLTGNLYLEDAYGTAATVLSLTTNLVTTCLIGYKAWQHKQFIKHTLKGLSCRTQVQRIMAVLVESGAIYCIIWLLVLGYEIFQYATPIASAHSVPSEAATRFSNGYGYFLSGCLNPLIGMYPTLVILLVALRKSPSDTVFSFQDSSIPTTLRLSFAPQGSAGTALVNGSFSNVRPDGRHAWEPKIDTATESTAVVGTSNDTSWNESNISGSPLGFKTSSC